MQYRMTCWNRIFEENKVITMAADVLAPCFTGQATSTHGIDYAK